ncbi:protein ZINC INDUCED FACILITATOR-LIKE 1 isoform X4 [Arachis duranensis]|uniref:Protein ZINC INDUCED FACILITATOR-LIKE 1 isoform X4 n=1 Tax=Arachis duranensis TaxID=130453 RepID=A0A9C6THX9_ARADU|nr:protein ZINC INDUCED FACILITATOR-LIKE 1 isoform X4 [Arachis duranensis]
MRNVDYHSNNNNVREALLVKKKQYHEDCPGCKVDQVKDMNHSVSIKNLFIIWIVVLCATLPISSLFPFLYFMVRDFNIAETEADIGSYAGYVGSTFMLGRCLTSVMWGMISDRYGRKPVIIIGVITVVIFNTLFGLSTSFWMAILMRFLLGSLNGLLGPVKAYATEIFREEHQSLGLSTVSAAWGIGLIIGPALGGYLAQPVEKYPNIFAKDSFWDKFPYVLPCFVISGFALVVSIVCIWIPETLHNHKESNEFIDDAEAIENGSSGNKKDKNMIHKKENLLLNWPLMSSIIAYCVFSLHDIAYQEVFSLWAVAPPKLGGLNFTTDVVGDVLAVSDFIHSTFAKFLLHDNVIRHNTILSDMWCFNSEESSSCNSNNWVVPHTKQSSAPKRGSQWPFNDCYVSIQSSWSCCWWCSINLVTEADGCFFPPRAPYGILCLEHS